MSLTDYKLGFPQNAGEIAKMGLFRSSITAMIVLLIFSPGG
jgi:hypothetical protein